MDSPVHIVGQGLAGTALAWRCHQRGVPFRIIDDERRPTASHVAAGIVTPIAGQRLALTQGWAFLEGMEAFYREIGALLGETDLYQRRETVRFLIDAREAQRWKKREGDPVYETEILREAPQLPPEGFHSLHGCFRMRRSGFLQVPRWLKKSRAWFRRQGCYERQRLSPEDCSPDDGLWVFANGPWLFAEPRFDWLPMRYAHGDILTLRIPDLQADRRIFNGACWLLPLGDQLWRAGATYEASARPETQPSPEGRAWILERLRAFLRFPFQIEDHQAAVRPVTLTRFPTMGRHPSRPHLAWFGGFSSKGVLTSPHYADRFLDHLLDDAVLPPEVEVT